MIVVTSGPRAVSRIGGALRLAAAMLGMDYPPVLVFLDEGVNCLRPGALDPGLWDYLKASADLADVHVLSESLEERGLGVDDLDPRLGATPIDMDGLAEMAEEVEVTVAF
ncbi:hypothetical protein DRO42_04495 [Candidatus Bathyarchaeota archaeon]|nr:MAG: hypothetical protein DRO42_04495 [Candidatus Bathyarchaeota archaeon]